MPVHPLFGLVLVLPAPILPEEEDRAVFLAAFAGTWMVVDDRFTVADRPCAVVLVHNPTDDALRVETEACDPATSAIDAWDILDEQLVLRAGDNSVAALGGSPQRVTGLVEDGRPYIFERPLPSESAAELAAAFAASGCFYLGYSARCATPTDLAPPARATPEEELRVGLLVRLNVRTEPRADADILGTLPESACIAIEQCAAATDGLWCQAMFGEQSGWLRKFAVRQGQWPVVTYVSDCSVP